MYIFACLLKGTVHESDQMLKYIEEANVCASIVYWSPLDTVFQEM